MLVPIRGLLGPVTGTLLFLAYNGAYTVANTAGASNDDITSAKTVMDGVWHDWVKSVIDSFLTEAVIFAKVDTWYDYNMKMAGKEVKSSLQEDGESQGELMAKMIKFIDF